MTVGKRRTCHDLREQRDNLRGLHTAGKDLARKEDGDRGKVAFKQRGANFSHATVNNRSLNTSLLIFKLLNLNLNYIADFLHRACLDI